MLELLTDFDKLEDMLEDQHMLAKKYIDEENNDKNFIYTPTELVFRVCFNVKICS